MTAAHPVSPAVRPAALWEALIPVIALIFLIRISLVNLESTAHIPLLLSAAIAALMGRGIGHRWHDIEQGILGGIVLGLKAILILLVIGTLIGTWIAGGIVPTLIYYGLSLLSPSFFLVAACLICCVVSVATGSSWTTAGTVGIALIGVGQGLEVPTPMIAGAIVSGAYFGDKISPLSDTTNLAPAVAGSELFEHIRYMLYTTLPSLGIALLIYAILGWTHGSGATESDKVDLIRHTLEQHFNLNPLLLIPPLLVILMVMFRLPALPALFGGALLGALLAGAFQDASLKSIVTAAQSGYVSNTGVETIDTLLSRGGLDNMLPTVSLILAALTFGGAMERAGLLAALATAILRLARGTGRLVTATVVTCIGMNILAPDQYLSIIVSGRMYREAYHDLGLHPKLLSRTLEDSGTLSSPLVPWNTCGAFMSTTLGVGTLTYLPYAFLNLLNPFVAIAIAFAGWKIATLPNRTQPANPPA
ncbi:MAG: Na+/H+ antiporter NhaC [Verrucomicrobia bacterium]|nr:Na+/H+ antiporter NhaC [Verrucomicrobiota bacterium]